MKYNVGDKLKCLQDDINGTDFKSGQIVEIEKITKEVAQIGIFIFHEIVLDESFVLIESGPKFKEGDRIRGNDGKCWTVAKVHTDNQLPYDIDLKEVCMSGKSEEFELITKEEYLAYHEIHHKDELSEALEKSYSGSCEDCTCGKVIMPNNSDDMNSLIEYEAKKALKAIQEQNDPVENPSHYTQGKIEVIEFIEDQQMDFRLANALKYICRARYKGKTKQDLEKAIWYINRYISKEYK